MTSTTIERRRRLGGLAQVAAPVLLVAGALTHPREVNVAGAQLAIVAGGVRRWYIAHLLYVMATVVFVPAVLALGHRLRERAPRMELWGTGLAVTGLFSTACLVALEGFGGWQLAQIGDRPAATQAFDRFTTAAGTVVPFAIVGLTLSAGLVVLAVGLARASAAPAWICWTLGAGAVLLAAGLAAAFHPAFLAGVVGIAVALVGAGLDDLDVAPSSERVRGGRAAPLAATR